ncbi:MAG: ABC transporter permease [Anaerotignum sp.]|nr:ABC transporter permease [Anaerotignum sp.]
MIFENIKLAFSAIRANKMRSFLTMLGMIIGISSVIAIVSLGDTMRSVVASEYENVGTGLAYLYIVTEDGYYSGSEMFTKEDAERVKEAMGDDLTYVGFYAQERCELKAGRKKETVYLTGMAENPTAMKDPKMLYGRMLNDRDILEERRHIILDKDTAYNIFGVENAVGKTLQTTIGGEMEELMVIGVYENTDSALMQMLSGGSFKTAYAPESIMLHPDNGNWSLYFCMDPDGDMAKIQEKVRNFTARLKDQDLDAVRSYSAMEEMDMMDRVLSSLSMVVGAIAAISLLVGGIGIMNIMLVSVTERTREIGIRKALGAQTKDILIQFLIEAAAISAAGGIIGTALGVSVVAIGGAVVGIGAVVKPSVVAVAVIFSAVVGLGFGLYPARKAAKKDPVEALRYE